MESRMPLREAGRDCRDALDLLIQSTSQQGLAWPSELLMRFNIWAKEALLYNDGKHSLDYQVRKNSTVRAMLEQFLVAIRANINLLVEESIFRSGDYVRLHAEYGLSGEKDIEGSIHRDGKVSDEVLLDHEDIIFRINDGLARLTRLSRRMRRHVRKKLDAEADDFDPPGDDGEAITFEFCNHLDWTLSQHPESPSEGSHLRERLKSTMLLRWRRICFHSNRAENKTIQYHAAKLSSVQQTQKFPSTSRSNIVEIVKQEAQPPKQLPDKRQSIGIDAPKSMQSAGITIGPSLKLHEDSEETHSVAPSRTFKSLVGVRSVDYPKAPKTVAELSGFFCPLCGSQQPAMEHKPQIWQLHVLRDLTPYICIYEHCDSPDTRYGTTKEWLDHMDKAHQEHIWLCQTCHREFGSRLDFEQHFTQSDLHDPPVHLSSSALALLAMVSMKPRKFPRCLFCQQDAHDEADDMRLHMAEHLRKFALASIPWHVFTLGSSEFDADGAPNGGSSRAGKSSVLRMRDYVDAVSLRFEADGDEQADDSTQSFQGITNVLRRTQPSERERRQTIVHWLTTSDFLDPDKIDPPAKPGSDGDLQAKRDLSTSAKIVDERTQHGIPRTPHRKRRYANDWSEDPWETRPYTIGSRNTRHD